MTKYFFSKTKDTEGVASVDKAIIIDGQNVKFYRNGSLNSTLTVSNITMPKKSIFERLPNIDNTTYSHFFNENEETHSIDDNHAINAFAYLRANNINGIDTTDRWPS